MRAPAFTALSYPASSSHTVAGSAHVIPLLPQKCCSPAIFVVAFDGILDFTSADAPPRLVARAAVNEAAARAAETPMASVRLMPYLLEQPSHRPFPVIRPRPRHRNMLRRHPLKQRQKPLARKL